jgi:hypothetical protein
MAVQPGDPACVKSLVAKKICAQAGFGRVRVVRPRRPAGSCLSRLPTRDDNAGRKTEHQGSNFRILEGDWNRIVQIIPSRLRNGQGAVGALSA